MIVFINSLNQVLFVYFSIFISILQFCLLFCCFCLYFFLLFQFQCQIITLIQKKGRVVCQYAFPNTSKSSVLALSPVAPLGPKTIVRSDQYQMNPPPESTAESPPVLRSFTPLISEHMRCVCSWIIISTPVCYHIYIEHITTLSSYMTYTHTILDSICYYCKIMINGISFKQGKTF